MVAASFRNTLICLTLCFSSIAYGDIEITQGYTADANNVHDNYEHYDSGYQSGLDDAANRAEKDYTQHPDEYDYYTESAYSRGYEDGFRGFGGAGAMHGGAGSGGGRR